MKGAILMKRILQEGAEVSRASKTHGLFFDPLCGLTALRFSAFSCEKKTLLAGGLG